MFGHNTRVSLAVWLMAAVELLASGCAGSFDGLKGSPQGLHGAQETIAAAFRPRRIAMMIGIDAFQDRRWPSLKYAAKDAQDLAAVLKDPTIGRFDDVSLLTAPAETTRERILAAVDELASKNLSPDDTILFFISSHGTLERAADGQIHQYVVTQDTVMKDVPNTALDLSTLKTAFNMLKSQKKVLVLAFCHSGQGKSQLNDTMQSALSALKGPFFVKPIETVSEATIVLTASSWGETAREDRTLENDIYTHFLVEAIRGKDRNGDGAVTVTEAHDYAKERTYYFTKGEQRPSMESVILGADPIILSGEVTHTGKPVLYDYSSRYQDLDVVVDGQNKGTLPSGIAVEPGVHRVVLTPKDSTEPIFDERVRVRAGQELSIPLLLNGYDQGLAVLAGYQGFLTGKVDEQVARPLVMYGLAYTKHSLFGSRIGVRADVAYGQDHQTLTVGAGPTPADVTQLAYGAALLYRYPTQWLALYAGPRLGGLYMTRDLSTGAAGKENNHTITPGGLLGFNLRYKQRISVSAESAVNYANINIGGTNASSVYYNLFGGFSVNF